ncbi:tetratricopeptide repeat protein [Uliginosibacterium sp. H3]|uniref:Tetratricopeptide repeat protein n=1 Tax=Uliginosibacterium silvisoli TaxID=3114758 RepID=A0ABU6K476_9RHOO|nr:tetratricopeptide repeat protein [Uliginosibacterium sp. H3]
MQEGTQLLEQGQKEKGLAVLSAAARANPASADPWVKTAQTQFDAENYPAAIVAADEAQKRDPARKETKAIAVVASLRVAVRALTDMREDSALRGNTRSEAEKLARMLRETLGQDVLVPIPQPEEPRAAVKRPPATTPAPATPTQSSRSSRKVEPAPAKPAATPPASAGGDANPFSVLK